MFQTQQAGKCLGELAVRRGKSSGVMCGITLTAEIVGKLLSKGKTDLIKGFTSHKSGKNFDAYLVFNATSGRISYDFPPRK